MSPVLALALLVADATPHTAKVREVTLERVYLLAGRADGLAIGTELRVMRGQKEIARCLVDQLGPHHASCEAKGAGAHDVVRWRGERPREGSAEPARPRPKVTSVAEITAVQRALAASPVEPFAFAGEKSPRLPWRALEASLEHTSYLALGQRGFARERLDVIVDGLSLGFGGFRAYARGSLNVWSDGSTLLRLRPREIAQLYVWQLELSSREIGRPFALAIGRISPMFAPGIALVDGGQVGWRSKDGSLEIGAVGGLVPDNLRVVPRFDAYAASLYYGHDVVGRGVLRWLRHAARAGVRGQRGVFVAVEIEAAADARIDRFLDLGGQVRVTMRDSERFTPRLELLSLRAATRPIAALNIAAEARYFGVMGAELDGLSTAYWIRGDRLHFDLDVLWRPAPRFAVGADFGAVQDFTARLGRQYVGPLVQLPGLAGGHLTLAAAYREEFGWTRGRYTYVQAAVSFEPHFRAVLRASYAADAPSALTADAMWHELAGFIHTEGRVTGHLRWLVQTSLRAPVGAVPVAQLPAIGLVLRAGVSGTF